MRSAVRFARRIGLALVILAATAGPAVAAPPTSPADVVDVPVEFRVVNVNETAVPCAGDGRTYTIRGHLTAPRHQLDGDGAITLYQHSSASGEWYWRLPVPGYHHAYEMAARGHASLTIDRLGYDSSDVPEGAAACIGAQATMAHQIVQALRRGEYRLTTGDPAPGFGKVFLAGHSNGGQLAETAAYTFGDVDAIVLMAWSDRAISPEVLARVAVATGQCATGGLAHESGNGTTGYVYFDRGSAAFAADNFADTDPAVLAAAVPLQNQLPCGDLISQSPGLLLNLARAGEITVPVLTIHGEYDRWSAGGADALAGFVSAPEKRSIVVAGAGHLLGQSRSPARIFDPLADWLDKYSTN